MEIFMKTARFLVTLDCNRDCSYCCNKGSKVVEEGIRLDPSGVYDIAAILTLGGYEAICISGGEPVLKPEKVKAIIQAAEIRKIPVFLYSATFTKLYEEIVPKLSGLTFTIHEHITAIDLVRFERLQELLVDNPSSSYRLNIHKEVEQFVKLYPKVWSQVNIFTPLEECPLPSNEVLYRL